MAPNNNIIPVIGHSDIPHQSLPVSNVLKWKKLHQISLEFIKYLLGFICKT